MRYPVVLFDVGETLIGPRDSFGAVYHRVLGSMGVDLSADLLERSMRGTWDEMDRIVPAGADRYAHFPGGETGYWQRFLARTVARADGPTSGNGFAREALTRLRAAFLTPDEWRVYPDVFPALESLKRAGARLGVVSNWDCRLPAILRMLGLADHFDTVVVSHLVGVEKPSAAIFERALDRLCARPEQALHVGDVPELDLAGARAAGIAGLIVDRNGTIDPSLGPVADLEQAARVAVDGRRDAG
jgi:putative hydrolase of the HAD superfamily